MASPDFCPTRLTLPPAGQTGISVRFGGLSMPFEMGLSPTPLVLLSAAAQTSQDKTVNCLCTTAPFTLFLGPLGFVGGCQLTQESGPSMTFLFVGSQICRWLPSDLPSRESPCRKLVVLVSRLL